MITYQTLMTERTSVIKLIIIQEINLFFKQLKLKSKFIYNLKLVYLTSTPVQQYILNKKGIKKMSVKYSLSLNISGGIFNLYFFNFETRNIKYLQ